MALKLRVQILCDDSCPNEVHVLAETVVRGIPEDLKENPVDPFADAEGRLREIAGAAAYTAHKKARAFLDAWEK